MHSTYSSVYISLKVPLPVRETARLDHVTIAPNSHAFYRMKDTVVRIRQNARQTWQKATSVQCNLQLVKEHHESNISVTLA